MALPKINTPIYDLTLPSHDIKVKYRPRGAPIPRTRMVVINNTGNPLPSPCITRPEVMAIATRG